MAQGTVEDMMDILRRQPDGRKFVPLIEAYEPTWEQPPVGNPAELKAKAKQILATRTHGKLDQEEAYAVIMAALGEAGAGAIVPAFTEDLTTKLRLLVDMHKIYRGEKPDPHQDEIAAQAANEWDSDLDDELDHLFSGFILRKLGNNFVGDVTVDARLDEPGNIESLAGKTARELAKAVFTNFTDPTFAKIEEEWVFSEVEKLMAGTPQTPGMDDQTAFMALIPPVAGALTNRDLFEIMTDLGQVADADNVIAGSAAQRLGFDTNAIMAARQLARTQSATWIDHTISYASQHNANAAGQAPTGTAVPPQPTQMSAPQPGAPAANPAPASKPKGRGRGSKAKDAEPMVPAEKLPALIEALKLTKEHLGVSDEELGEMFGISRSHFNNVLKGKKTMEPTQQQAVDFYNHLLGRAQGLQQTFQHLSTLFQQ
jgi:hypothetical protein